MLAVVASVLLNRPDPKDPLHDVGTRDASDHTSRDGEWNSVNPTLTSPWAQGEVPMRELLAE